MAVYSSVALGKARGSVGGLTFTVQRGQTIVKSKPVSVANPQTATQVAQRSRFSDASNYAKHLANLLQRYHKPTQNKYSPRNSFMNSMLKLNGSSVFTPANVAPLPILYANGPLSLPSFTHEVAPDYDNGTSTLSLDISWSGILIGQDADADKLNLALINVTTGVVQETNEAFIRSEEAAQVSFSAMNNTNAFVVVAFFVNSDGTKNGIGYPIATVIAGTAAGYAGGNNSNMPF